MFKLITLVFTLFVFTGCTSMSLQEQSPKPTYVVTNKVLVAVVDERVNGKAKNYYGTAYGPLYNDELYIEDLADQDGDEKRDLAEYLSLRIVTGLNNNKWHSSEIYYKTVPSLEMAELIMKENGADYLIVLALKEWEFSMDGKLTLDTDTDILVYQAGKGKVLDSNIKRDRKIPIEMRDNLYSVARRGFMIQTSEIINDRKLREALTN